jgi:hypothetical protein
MAEPTITIYINTVASDAAPGWCTISTSQAIYWSGPNTDASVLDPVTREVLNKWAESLWIGNYPVYSGGTRIASYSKPSEAVIYSKMFMVSISSYDCSDYLELTAYDTTLHDYATLEIFGAGNVETDYTSWIKAKNTGYTTPTTVVVNSLLTGWCTFNTATSGASSVNALRGTFNFIRWTEVIPSTTNVFWFALAMAVPPSASAGYTGKDCIICLKYKWI